VNIPLIDLTAAHSWGGGRVALSSVLAREHQVVPWVDEPEVDPAKPRTVSVCDPTRVRVGSTTFRVPHTALVRYRGDVAVLHDRGRVRVICERGEIVLDAAEESALRASWSLL
jgi:hypothetical protein